MDYIYIEFENVGKVFVCENRKGIKTKSGDYLIVETGRGKEFAKVVKIENVNSKSKIDDLQNEENCENKTRCNQSNCGKCCKGKKSVVSSGFNILRVATSNDLEKKNTQKEKGKQLVKKLQSQADNLGLNIKILDVDYTVDGTKMLIDFVSEERVDFRQFVKALASEFKIKIELRQIGGRDEAKKIGGIGPCGRVCCCNCFLREFDKVAIKMAKNQNISLNPNKINGLCGKLMCCLAYENEMYEDLIKNVPRVGSVVQTDLGEGVVMFNDILRQQCTIKLSESEEYKVFDIKDLQF